MRGTLVIVKVLVKTTLISLFASLVIFVQSNYLREYVLFVAASTLLGTFSVLLFRHSRVTSSVVKKILFLMGGTLCGVLILAFTYIVYGLEDFVTWCNEDKVYQHRFTGKIVTPDCYDGRPAWYYQRIE